MKGTILRSLVLVSTYATMHPSLPDPILLNSRVLHGERILTLVRRDAILMDWKGNSVNR